MTRCATLAALCAFGLTNVAHASFALSMGDTSGLVFNLTPIEITPGSVLNTGNTPIDPTLLGITPTDPTSTVTVSPPASDAGVTPTEPPPGGGMAIPFIPMPTPGYSQQAGMDCTGAFSVSFGANTTVTCQADLWFTNGFLDANQSIVVNALGNILVDSVSFKAPVIQFNAGANFVTSTGPLWLGGHTTINALGVNLAGPVMVSDAGSININSQTINISPTIPEPSTWVLMGLGLVGLSLAARRKA
jgi:hypothetical protein